MKHDLNNKNFERKAKRIYSVFACVALLLVATAVPALAADDPLTVVNNLSDFIFSLIRAIGSSCWASVFCRWACLSRAMTPPARQRYADGGRRYRHYLY